MDFWKARHLVRVRPTKKAIRMVIEMVKHLVIKKPTKMVKDLEKPTRFVDPFLTR